MGFVEPTRFRWTTDRASGRSVKKVARDTKWKARYTDPSGRDRSRTFDRKIDAVIPDIRRDAAARGRFPARTL